MLLSTITVANASGNNVDLISISETFNTHNFLWVLKVFFYAHSYQRKGD